VPKINEKNEKNEKKLKIFVEMGFGKKNEKKEKKWPNGLPAVGRRVVGR
jgi:hypothetical protein